LCEKTLIDHHTTSWDHLKINMLIKQMMKTMKQGLQKYGLHKAILKIRTYNYHGWLWGTSLVSMLFFHIFHHISYSLAMNSNYQS
jgi:hypothetical protein